MVEKNLAERFRSAVQRKEAASSLANYATTVFPAFELAQHHQTVIDALESVEQGRVRRLILVQPPRHGKSLLVSQLFPGWYLGRHSGRSIIAATYAQELSDDFGRRVRNIVASDLHRAIFPSFALAEDSQSMRRFNTSRDGAYFSVGRGGAITGRGCNLLIIDDPLKDREEAFSETIRHNLHDWFRTVAFTRLAPGAAVIVVATRWHEDDLIGMLLREHAEEGWKVVNMPAIAEQDEGFRRAGDALWPSRYPLEALESIRRQIGSAAFVSLYQGRPSAAEGTIFQRSWWRFYATPPTEMKRKVLSLDSAFKTGQQNDFSCLQVWGEAKTGFYLLANWRQRCEFPTLKRVLLSFYQEWRPNYVLIEDTASGQSLLQVLRVETSLPLKGVRPDKDKISRAQACTGMLEAGRVFLPQDAPWLNNYLDELSSFPSAPHDDQVDTTSMSINFLHAKPVAGAGALEFFKRQGVRAGAPYSPELFDDQQDYARVVADIEREKAEDAKNSPYNQVRRERGDMLQSTTTSPQHTLDDGTPIVWIVDLSQWMHPVTGEVFPVNPRTGKPERVPPPVTETKDRILADLSVKVKDR